MITSGVFWLILLVGVPLYWLVPRRLRMGWLAAVSFGYLAYLTWTTALLMLAISLVFFLLAPRPGSRWVTAGLIFLALGCLAWFKYLPALLDLWKEASPGVQIAIPLGLSYFTFKLIHYAVEVRRGNITDRSLATYLCYVFLFPIFAGGPIERFDHFVRGRSDRCEGQALAEGLTRIAHGLIKRFVLVEQVLLPLHGTLDTSNLLLQLPEVGALRVWGWCVISFLYAYLDFSALSDVAIGASRLFGLEIMENFRWPVLARNIGDFWKRWHMTLAGWCQSYVYMPMIGLTRRPYVAIYATFLAMGLWHAASLHWVGWGLYHGTGVALFLTFSRWNRTRGWRIPRVLATAVTFLFVSAGAAFPSVWGVGSAYDSVRIVAKLVGVDLPAGEDEPGAVALQDAGS